MKLIDVNAGFGGRESIQRFGPETMLEQLERIPCGRAFVHCNQGPLDPGNANDQVFGLCREQPWLLPVCWIHPRDTVLWRGEVDRCLAKGAKLFRIDPVRSEWPVRSIFLEEIVEKLASSGAVLIADASTPGNVSAIAEATANVNVPVVFTEARYFPLSELLPIAQRHPNVFIETSRITSPDGIELCVETLGAERLLFGSGAARYPAWVAWQVLERADISEEARTMIAWRNASLLLGVEPIEVDRPVPSPCELQPIIDIHMHDRFPGAPLLAIPPEAYEAVMEKNGIIHGVSSSYTAIFYDLAQGNNEQAERIRRIPRLRGYVVVDPRYEADSRGELRRLETDPAFVGVKIGCPYSHTPTNAPSLRRLFTVLAEYERPVLIHPLGDDWPEALVEIALAHPRLPIIAAHTGYGDAPHPTHDAADRLAAAPNIFLEFCSTYLAAGAIRRGINAAGIDRILYGSDFPLISERYMRAAYEDAGLTQSETAAIYRRNAERLFPAFASIG